MPTKAEISVNDESYMTAVFSPKMTMDEVGADIDTHGHIPVTAETATQDPFTAKGGLAYALDEVVDGTLGEVFREAGKIAKGSDTDKPKSGTGGIVETKSTNLSDPTNDFRDETKGEVEGITDTPQGDYTKPTIQQDKAVSVKDSLCAALDSLVFDSATDTENEPTKEQGDYYEGNASALKTKAPDLPESLGGDNADENGLVYITRTFTVDPEKYVSINYRPKALAGAIKDAAKAGKAPNAAKAAQGQPIDGGENADPNAEAEISDLGNPDGGTENEPTAKEEAKAAKEANAELKEEQAADKGKSAEKGANDELPESVVLDYATFLDGSSFLCFDESNGIDYSKIAMDAGPRKKVTRENCETTFEQCRAQNPLFCRFHGPKLLEADIRTAIIAQFRSFKKDTRGFTCSVTKDKDSKNPMSFRLTIGCTPAQKRNVEQILDKYFKNNPGIKSNDGMHELGGNQFTQEFDMDILRADEPPKRGDTKGEKWLDKTKAAIASGKKQAVVGETPDSVMQKLNGGAMPESAGQEEAMQPQGEAPEAVADNPQQLEKQLEAEEPVPVESTEPQAGQEPTEQPAEKPVAEPEQKQKPQAEQTQAGTPEATQEPQEATPEQTTEPTPEQPTEQPTPEPEAKPTEQEPEAEQTEAAKPQEQPTEQPQGEETAEKKTKQKGKKGGNPNNLNQYTYESYGEMPIEDPDSPDIGGTGDVLGSELLQYAAKCGGILKMPRGMGDYLKALSRWERAAKTGGNYKGVKPNALNRPTMNSFGITDPMADWIAGYLDGGTREKRPGEFHLLFGKRNKYGANDEGLDAAPEEIRNLFEQGGMQAVAEALLEAINKYKAWVDRATSHRTAAMNRAAQEAQDREDESLSFDEAELRDRDAADKEYDEALAEVYSYDGDSPTIRYFDRDKMKSLKSGDTIRFDHSDTDFEVLGYDSENDTLTVVPKASEDNPFTEEEKADLTRAYRVGEHGFEPVDDISPETGTQTEGATENESENKEGTGETGSGNAVRQNGGTESASGASGGTEPEASDGKPTDADIRAACRHIGSTRKLKAKPNYEEWQLEDMEDSDRMGEEAEWEMKDVLKGDAFTGFGMDGIPLDGYSRSRREEAKALLSDLPEGDSFQKVRKALEAIALAPEDYGYMPSGDDITLAAHKLSSVTGMSVAALKQDLGARVEGWTPITKPDLDFLTNTLGADSKVVKRLTDLYRTEGNTEKLEQSVKAADTALKGNPSADIRETAESIKKDAATAKEQNRIADELTERLGTMKDSEGGLGNALTKAAIESAVGESRDKAIKADQKAADSAKRLQKQSEESYREAERKAKGEAAARVEQALTEMAKGIFGKDSKSETIAEEADAVAGWMEGLAKKKGIEFSPSSEFTAALEGVKKESEQLEWLMGDLKKAMDVSGKDFQAEDVNYLSEAIAKKAAKIGRAFAELNGLGMAEIARINKAAELAEQKAKLEKRSGVAQTQTQTQSGGTSGRPSEGDFQSAAMELANSGIDTLDDAFAGLSAIVDGKVQGFGSMSSAEMTREMAGRYIEALEKGGDKFKPMVEALNGAVEKLPKEDGKKEAEPFALESVTAEQETAERKKRKEKAAIKKGQEAELHGSAGEVGQQLLDLGGAEGEDLFNRTARSTETAKPEVKKPEAKEEPKSEQAKPEVKAESETPKPEQKPEVKPEPKPEPKTETAKPTEAKAETASGGSSGGEMDSRIEGIYKDWVEEPIPEWVRGLSADESKKYADMLEAARDWDTDDTNTAFEELTKYEETKSKEYEENKAKAKEEAKKREEAAKAEAAKAQKAKEEAERVAKSGHSIQDVMAASKRLGLDAFKPEPELRRMLAIAKKLSGRDKRFEQRAKDLEVMLADREAKKNQKSTRGTGNYAGTVEDSMPKEALLKMVAEAVVSALEG